MVFSFLFGGTVNRLVPNLTNNVNTITDGCLKSVEMVSHRLDISLHLLTNTMMGFLTTCSLSFLLYLTDFSPFLRIMVWFLVVSVCFRMICNYIMHSNSMRLSQPDVSPMDLMADNDNAKRGKQYMKFHPIQEQKIIFIRCIRKVILRKGVWKYHNTDSFHII